METASRKVVVPAIAAITVVAVCALAAATFAPRPAGGPSAVEPVALSAAARLDAADRALSRGYAHGAALDLREAALDFRHLAESWPAGTGHLLIDDSLALEGAAIAADDAALRSSAALRRRSLQPRLHLAAYTLLAVLPL
ncbi:MAG: hypothetical protein JWQ76_861 [Ramlibacter sp.]|nr:hypothetical protein [Ramlibacter sp.]